MDAERLLGEQVLYVLRPLDQAEAAAVKVVVETDIEGLFQALDAIEIKMEEGLARRRPVFIDDGESRGTDGIFPDAEFLAKSGRKGGLAGAHRGIEGHDAVLSDFGEEGFRRAGQIGEVPDEDGMLLHGGTKIH